MFFHYGGLSMTLSFSASYIAMWVMVLFQGLLILALLRQLSELRELAGKGGLDADNRLPTGSVAPAFIGLDLFTGRQAGGETLTGSGGIVLFLSPDCGLCESLTISLRTSTLIGMPRIITLCQGGEQACKDVAKLLGSDGRFVVNGVEEIAARYGVSRTPTAVVVDSARRIRAYGHPRNAEELKQLFARSVGEDAGSTAGPDRDTALPAPDITSMVSRV